MHKNWFRKKKFQTDHAWWDKQLGRRDMEERMVAFYESIHDAIVTDDEYWLNKGRDVIEALVNDDARAMLIALCGWSAESLAKRVFLLRGRPQYQDEEIPGTLMVEWSDGKRKQTPCVIQHTEHLVCGFDYGVFSRTDGLTAEIQNVFVRFMPLEDGNEYDFQCVSEEERNATKDDEIFWYYTEDQ